MEPKFNLGDLVVVKSYPDREFLGMDLGIHLDSLVKAFAADGVGSCGATKKVTPGNDFVSDDTTRANALVPND